MRVLVTGAAGFLGLNIMDVLESSGHDPIGVTRATLGADTAGVALRRHHYVVGDMRDPEGLQRIVSDLRPTHIVHAAAMTPSTPMERDNPLQILATNEASTLALLQAAAANEVTRFVFISSAAVYASPQDSNAPLSEDAPLNQNGNLYALTKIASERLCQWATNVYSLDTRSVRVGPVYGIHERPTASRCRMSALHRAVTLALDGEHIRCNRPDAVHDWIFSTDAATAITRVLEEPDLPSRVFNLAGPNISVRSLLNTICGQFATRQVGWSESDAANLDIPEGYRRAPLDASRLQAEVGFSPAYPIEAGLKSYLAWLESLASS